MAGEADGEVVVPPTLQALLAARLDQLEPAERSVLERGAIEGEIFHRGAVQALAPEETQVTPRLAALVRKELIRPDKPQLAGEDGFRFRHLLIRDAAYDALPKATRAELHERFAAWLEEHGAELVELDEILGYHLEQACRYRAELGLPDDDELAAAARRRLTAGGRRAALRQDYGAAVEPARARRRARPAGRARPRPRDRARRRSALGRQGRRRTPARRCPRRARLGGGRSCRSSSAGGSRRPSSASPRAGGRDGEAGCARRAGAARVRGRRRRPGAVHRLLRARGGGVHARRRWTRRWRHSSGPSPTLGGRACGRGSSPGVARALAASSAQHPCPECWRGSTRTSRSRAGTLAPCATGPRRWRCSVASTRRARSSPKPCGAGRARRRDSARVLTGTSPSEVELLAGDPAAAAEFGAEGCRLLEELGEKGYLSTAAANLAQALYALDRLEEADAWAGRAAELGASDDAIDGAALAPGQGEGARTSRRARGGRAPGTRGGRDRRTRPTCSTRKATRTPTSPRCSCSAGKPDEAAAALEQALERYERKGNLASAERTRARLDELVRRHVDT